MENKAERNKTRNLKKMNQGNRVGSLKDKQDGQPISQINEERKPKLTQLEKMKTLQ